MDAVVGLVQSGVESVHFSEVAASISFFVAAEVDEKKQVKPSMTAFASTIVAVAEVTSASFVHFVMLQVVVNLMLQLMLFLPSLDQLPSVEIVRLAAMLAVASFVLGQNVVEHYMEWFHLVSSGSSPKNP